MDALTQAFAAAQGWLFETAVQPLIFHLGLMAYVENAYEAVGAVMIGVIEIGVLCALLKPLEAWRPIEQWQDTKAVRSDVIYTWLNRLGLLPLLIFLLLVIPVSELDAWLRMNDIVRPNIEDVIPGIARNGLGAFIIFVIVIDFVEYAMHRLQHRFNWWWALHSLHHSQRQMSFWTDDRNHLLDDVLTSAAVAIVALAIGVPSNQFVMIIIATRMIESLSHVNARLDFGRLGNRLLVSPAFHRRHHAIGAGHEGRYQGCNFATLFPVWDMMFRTADFTPGYQPTGIRDQLEGRDYGIGFWRQQWLGVVRLGNALLRRPRYS
ncbi:MAG TPA: sterol desaturase family protein [Burkholderiales bacterium]|nr:sterol desaturase family protein [Burkholderiales bacterium]